MSKNIQVIQQKIMHSYTKETTNILFLSMVIGIFLICFYSLFQIQNYGYFSSYSIQTCFFITLSSICLILNMFSFLSLQFKKYFIVIVSFMGWVGSLISYGYMSTGSLFILPFILYVSLLGKASTIVKYLTVAMLVIIIFYILQIFEYTGLTYINSHNLVSTSIITGEILIVAAIFYATIILSLGYMKAMMGLVNHLVKKNKSLADTTVKQKYLLSHDFLTGAHSRSFLLDNLDSLTSRKEKQPCTLIILDIVNFKQVNDKYGHTIGDKILKQVANAFKAWVNSFKPHGIIARIGGDEFCIYLPEVNYNRITETLIKISNQISLNIKKQMKVEFHSIRYAATQFPQDARTTKELMNNATLSILYGKENNSLFTLYSKDIQSYYQQQELLKDQCVYILEKNLISIFFQKQLDLKTNSCIGGEILLRVNQDKFPQINPFIMSTLCAKHAFQEELNMQIVKSTSKILKNIEPKNYFKVSINLLLPERMISNHIRKLIEYIKSKKLHKNIVFCFEIVESNSLEQTDLDKALRLIKSQQFEVAIDDFGVQYSNYKRLQSNNISTLKIDRSFITNLDTSNNVPIVKSMIEMAKHNNIKVVAEGVETEKELKLLKKLECDIIQGYYYHKPESLKQIDFSQI
ncbi:EAL domain-containing protein [Thiotrichales bacterium 19S11-10]|nr:EAL domain-containing protein [Thiotrichales bacterium 19S11-10]